MWIHFSEVGIVHVIKLSTLKVRLPATTIGLALLSATLMGGISWHAAREGMIVETGERLRSAAVARGEAIELLADRARADFLSAAAHPLVQQNFGDLAENLDPTRPDYQTLVDLFRKPDTVEQRVAMDGADTNTTYGRRHAKVQEVGRRLVGQNGYADLLFLNNDGRVVYTTTKGADFGVSVADPALAGTGLATIFEKLKGQQSEDLVFQDFAGYPVDGPSAFIGKAISRKANVAMGSTQTSERSGYVLMRIVPALFDQTLSKRVGLGETGETMAFGLDDGLLRSNPPLAGKAAQAGDPVSKLGIDAGALKGAATLDFTRDGVERMASSAPVDVFGSKWTVVAEQADSEATAAATALTRLLALSAAGVLALTALLGMLLARSIVRPLGALTRALQALAARQNVAEVAGSRRKDEIGDIARAVAVIRDVSLEEAAEQLKTTEALRLREETARRTMLRDLADGFEQSVGGIVSSVGLSISGLQTASGTMRTTVDGAAGRSTAVAAEAKRTAENINAVTAAARELAETISHIGSRVEEAASMSASAVTGASQAESVIIELSRAASRIGDVVGLVSEIANQTNLLALNATIEAARAGEAGKGFAVVAAEVKQLAGQTAQATAEIGQHVSSIQLATGGATEAIRTVTGQIQAMNEISTSIASAVEEQNATTQEIVRSMSHASAGSTAMTADIAEVAHAAGDAGIAASDVARAADDLLGQSRQLASEVEQFLGNVRAA